MDESKKSALVYDKIAGSYAREFSEPSEYIDEFLAFIPANGKILDLGCGVGVDSGYLACKGLGVTGVDLSEGMLNLAKQKFPNVDFRLADIRKLNFPRNSFDGVLASCSLIHIPKKDISKLLLELSGVLKVPGVIYIALQEGESKEIFIEEPFEPNEKLFLNVISYEEIKQMLFSAGFSIVSEHERKPRSKEELNFTKLFVIAKKKN